MKRLIALVALACATIACGSDNAPSSTTRTVAAASLQITGQGSWSNCVFGGCQLSASIQNTGAGCASGTAVVARFFDATGAQIGSDVTMGAAGGLSSLTIRSQQVVAVTSLIFVS